ILRAGCLVTAFSILSNSPPDVRFDIECTVAASTAVSDLLHDLQSAFDIVDMDTHGAAAAIRDAIVESLSDNCTGMLAPALAKLPDNLPDEIAQVRPLLKAYIRDHADPAALCAQGPGFVNRILNAIDDDAFHTPNKCAAATLGIHVPDLETDPVVSLRV